MLPAPRERESTISQWRERTSSTAVMGFGIAGMLRASVMVAAYGGICALCWRPQRTHVHEGLNTVLHILATKAKCRCGQPRRCLHAAAQLCPALPGGPGSSTSFLF